MNAMGRLAPDGMMHVILAQPRGFCAGVVRAIEIVERALARYGAPVYVRHEIVHNRHVVEDLESKGAIFVDDLADIPPGAPTIFSAHGVPQCVMRDAERRGLPVIDATCPLVAKVHAQARRYEAQGRQVVLIGHSGHPEVIGTLGQVERPALLVSTVRAVEALDVPADRPIAYVTQTTLSVDDTRDVIAALERRFADIVGPDVSDICYATQNRQTAVRALCRVAELILVVGAANSSNSTRLREIGTEQGRPSYLVADGSQVRREWFDDVAVVGLAAGASAPEVLVDDVIAAMRRITPLQTSVMAGPVENTTFRLPRELAAG